MDAAVLLEEIAAYCRAAGLAESTFGRRAVNDGKFVSRLRYGGRITTDTLDRVRAFMADHTPSANARALIVPLAARNGAAPSATAPPAPAARPERNFRFFAN